MFRSVMSIFTKYFCPCIFFSFLIFGFTVGTVIPNAHNADFPIFDLHQQQQYYGLHPDASLTTIQLINKYGYNGETHHVITKDGYILELHRIIEPNGNSSAKRPAVLLMHGLLASSAVWVISGPKKGLGYILVDAGYDVWLGNARGTLYSRNHLSLSISDKDYWNFSWHEIGTRDLPAMIDYILLKTDHQKLFYIAHSQGTTAFFVMASEQKEYQEKIEAAFAMGPVTYSSRMFSPAFQIIARFSKQIVALTKLIGQYEFKPTNECLKKFAAIVCGEGSETQPLCSNTIFLISGFSHDQFNKTLLPIIFGHVPAGASVKQFAHYGQLIKSGYFRQYDHGLFKNLKIYKRLTPPSYDLGSIKVPVSLHYSTNDWLAHVRDVHQLYNELGNPIGKFRIPHSTFNHIDFMWGIDVKELLYDKILSLMSRFKH